MLQKDPNFESEINLMNFDTHKSFKKIVAAGFTEVQAEAVIDLVRESKEYDLSKLSTKEQLNQFERSVNELFNKFERSVDERFNKFERSVDERFNNMQREIDAIKIELDSKSTKEQLNFVYKELNTKIDNAVINLTLLIEKNAASHDAKQKAWMIGVILSICGLALTIILKMP